MNLEFKIYKLNKDSKMLDILCKNDQNNEFIVVGEEVLGEKKHLKVHQIGDKGICFIADFKLDEFTAIVEKEELQTTCYTVTFDIPKEGLTLDIIENEQRLNAIN